MDRNFQLPPTHSLIVALDHSAGMGHPLPGGGTYLQAAVDTIEKLLHHNEQREITEYSLLHFGDDRVATQPFALDQPPPFLRQLRRLKAAGGATLRQAQHLALDEARGDDVRIVVLSRGYGTCGGRPLEVALDIGAGRRLKWTPPEQLVLKEVNSKKR